MPKMRVAQIARPGGAFEIVEREIPQRGVGWVRIKVQACGSKLVAFATRAGGVIIQP